MSFNKMANIIVSDRWSLTIQPITFSFRNEGYEKFEFILELKRVTLSSEETFPS